MFFEQISQKHNNSLCNNCPTHLSHKWPTHSSHKWPTHSSHECPTHSSHKYSSHKCSTHLSHECPTPISYYVLTSHFMYVWKFHKNEHRCGSWCWCPPPPHSTHNHFVHRYCSSCTQVSRRSSNKSVVPSTSGTMGGLVRYIYVLL